MQLHFSDHVLDQDCSFWVYHQIGHLLYPSFLHIVYESLHFLQLLNIRRDNEHQLTITGICIFRNAFLVQSEETDTPFPQFFLVNNQLQTRSDFREEDQIFRVLSSLSDCVKQPAESIIEVTDEPLHLDFSFDGIFTWHFIYFYSSIDP